MKKGCFIMVCFEDLNELYGSYPVFDRSSSNQADFNLQLDFQFSKNWKYLDQIMSGYKMITESRFCEEFYSIMDLKIHYKHVLDLLENRYKFKIYSVDEFNGEKTYMNMNLVH